MGTKLIEFAIFARSAWVFLLRWRFGVGHMGYLSIKTFHFSMEEAKKILDDFSTVFDRK
jgi:hypothetical protein